MKTLALLDPSLSDYAGNPSRNLGDLIIYDSVKAVIDEVVPGCELRRFATHLPYRREDCTTINRADLVILGGTNALCSYRGGSSWYYPHDGLFYIFPKIRRNILFGVGWGQGYPDPPSRRMTVFYHRVLSRKWMHSVRDEFTRRNLGRIGIRNVVNTGCPTTWKLHDIQTARTKLDIRNCLFTLTDYARHPVMDNRFIETLAESVSGRLAFFAQGDEDIEYITALAAFERNKSRIEFLERSFPALRQFLSSNHDFLYVGTRLHCGIFALQHRWEALILEVDNRAAEMARDFQLPVVPRADISAIKRWLFGQLDFGRITLPLENIQRWKGQFRFLNGPLCSDPENQQK